MYRNRASPAGAAASAAAPGRRRHRRRRHGTTGRARLAAAAFGGCVEVVDNLSERDVQLVEGVAAGGVGEKLGVDGGADGRIDGAGLGLGRGWRDVQLAEEGGEDFLFFFCFFVVSTGGMVQLGGREEGEDRTGSVPAEAVQDVLRKVEVHVRVDVLPLGRGRGIAQPSATAAAATAAASRGVALAGVGPVDEAGADGGQRDHLVVDVGVVVVEALAHVVQRVQGVERDAAHQVLVLGARVAEDGQEVVERLAHALAITSVLSSSADTSWSLTTRPRSSLDTATVAAACTSGCFAPDRSALTYTLRRAGFDDSSWAPCTLRMSHQVFLGERPVEERAQAETDETALAHGRLVAPHRGNDEVVEHGHEVVVLLQVARHVAEHALHDVQALHVDDDLLDGLGGGLLLGELGSLTLAALGRGAVVADLGLRRVEALVVVLAGQVVDDGVVHVRYCLEDDAAELLLARRIGGADVPQHGDGELGRLFRQLRNGQGLAEQGEHLAPADLVRVVQREGDVEQLLYYELLLRRVLLLVLLDFLLLGPLDGIDQDLDVALEVEGDLGDFGQFLLDERLVLAVGLVAAEIVEGPDDKHRFGTQGLEEVIVKDHRLPVVRPSLPKTSHGLQRHAVLAARVHDIDALQELEQGIEVGRGHLGRLARLGGRRGAGAVLDPALAEETAGSLAHVLISVAQAPPQQLLSHGQREVAEVAQGRQQPRVDGTTGCRVLVPRPLQEEREGVGQDGQVDQQRPPHVGTGVVLQHLEEPLEQAAGGIVVAIVRVRLGLDLVPRQAAEAQHGLGTHHGLLVADALQQAGAQLLEQVVVDGVERVDDVGDQLGGAVRRVAGVSGMVLASSSISPMASLSLSMAWRRNRPMKRIVLSPTPSLFLMGMTRSAQRTNSELKSSSSNSEPAAGFLVDVGS
ncbi:527a6312-da91-40de-952a-2fb30da66a4f [Thermothielavioides terrestris]|uniref:527a6312-da91-40de-952a-2fb30da66a4f n=1 Tax=Thermothielavioides terrestris TaxID=2587410 RepID=A0A446BU51_9PEZI|nr:527a6312-da91-40de-952a-2fb30da66a4f [Thermothielavioides terrestris]